MENIKLNNGQYLNRLYGKYEPNLTIISNNELKGLEDKQLIKFNESYWYTKTLDNKIIKNTHQNILEQDMIDYLIKKLNLPKLDKNKKYAIRCDYNDNYRYYLTTLFLREDGLWDMTNDIIIYNLYDYFIKDEFKKFQQYTYEFNNKIYSSANKIIIDNFNIPFTGDIMYIIEGKFRTNAKGTKIFDLSKNGDYLIKINWGGAFSKTRGIEIDKIKNYIYYKHASSNGGGTGYDYIIIDKNFTNEIDIEEI